MVFLFCSVVNNKIPFVVNHTRYNCSFNCGNSFQKYFAKHFSRALCRISNALRNVVLQNYCIIHCACTIVCHCEYIGSLSQTVEIHVRMLWKYHMGILCSLATVCCCCIMYNYYLTDVKININSHWVL